MVYFLGNPCHRKKISMADMDYKSMLWETCQKQKFKALKITFKPVKILLFLLCFTTDRADSKWTKYCNIKSFYKIRGVYSYNQWNYFQRRCMDKWRSGDFSLQTCCIPAWKLANWNSLLSIYIYLDAVINFKMCTCY